ncbi:phage tail protein [Paraburkholderia antibiotica]|uniref:Phage tail protein n=1 Tax=Paraburkholderia antibiotica TaxID=2728839 RepID=A0A7X9X5I9_9BURK|nr:phage tail protein [Paraburkholderia antibiotica]NML31773.1 phage tail protein [Paraburkholderia antibiotica]
MVVLCLGRFVFSMSTALFHELQRKRNWKYAKNSRVGARDAGQFNGPGDDLITLTGVIAPGQVGSAESLDMLTDMADAGAGYVLVDMLGNVHGVFIISSLDETQTYHDVIGIAQKIEFTLTLERADDLTLAGAAAASGAAATGTQTAGSLDAVPVPDAPAYVKSKKG